jgi:predicted AAA+ superfamily ATPase
MEYKRALGRRIKALAETFPAVVVTGSGHVGKTTLLRSLFPQHRYVSLDLPSEASRAELEPDLFLGQIAGPLLIDEVQYAPQLFRHIKAAIDADCSLCGRFILTGSQKFELMREVSDSLAGRVGVVELEGLSCEEIRAEQALPTWTSTLSRGWFPELWARPNIQPSEFYRRYVATYLERDVRQLINITSLRDFERFLRACAVRNGQVLNKTELGRDVGITEKTVTQWLSVVAASNQITLLEPYFTNMTKRLTKSPKLYFNDTGLLCFLLGLPDSALAGFSGIGAIWEAFVFSELRKLREAHALEASIWFYRDSAQRESDFVIDWRGELKLVEAKWSEIPSASDTKSIVEIRRLLGDRVRDMLIACRTAEPFPLPHGVRAVNAADMFRVFISPSMSV